MKFDQAIQALCDSGVEFVVIGGVAANLHGSVRVTWDLDICFSRTPANLGKLAGALAPFHPRLRGLSDGLPFVWDAKTLSYGTVFTLVTDLGDVDLLAEVAGVGDYEEAKAHSISGEAFGRRISLLDLPTLILTKRAAGRDRDLQAIPELESLLEATEPE